MEKQKFTRRHSLSSEATVTIEFEGQKFTVGAGETVSAALLASGVEYTRTTEKCNQKRAPYCQMGICFECLMEIDGKANQQSCLTMVRDGMKIKRQSGLRDIGHG